MRPKGEGGGWFFAQHEAPNGILLAFRAGVSYLLLTFGGYPRHPSEHLK